MKIVSKETNCRTRIDLVQYGSAFRYEGRHYILRQSTCSEPTDGYCRAVDLETGSNVKIPHDTTVESIPASVHIGER